MMPYAPVVFELGPPPARLERLQVLLRLLVLFVLGLVGVSAGWVFLLLYLALPVAAAVVIGGQGADYWLGRVAPDAQKLLRWLVSFGAYMMFLADRFPTSEATLARYEIHPAGRPTVAGALMRIVTTLPAALLLAILGCVSGFVWLICAVTALVAERAPMSLLDFQYALLRWQARLLAYHASFVELMPPPALGDGREHPAV